MSMRPPWMGCMHNCRAQDTDRKMHTRPNNKWVPASGEKTGSHPELYGRCRSQHWIRVLHRPRPAPARLRTPSATIPSSARRRARPAPSG